MFVFEQAIEGGACQVQAGIFQKFHFQLIERPQILRIALVPPGIHALQTLVQCPFPHVAKGGMPDVVRQADGFHQIRVALEPQRDALGDLRDFQRMRQASAKEGIVHDPEDLRLALQAPERRAVNDARPIDLEGATPIVLFRRGAQGDNARCRAASRRTGSGVKAACGADRADPGEPWWQPSSSRTLTHARAGARSPG